VTTSAALPTPALEPAAPAPAGFRPTLVMDVELAAPLPPVPSAGYRRARVTGRLHSEPVGTCVIALEGRDLSPDELAALLWADFREPVADRFEAVGRPAPGRLTGAGLSADPASWPFLRRRRAVLASAPFISVVVCTRDRPDQLQDCLHLLGEQEYPRFEVVVVDNASRSGRVTELVNAQCAGSAVFRCVDEPRPGLSWARNTGIAAASGDIIAFLDDDEEPDRHWLAGLASGFARAADIGCVSGMVLPARLDTPAQELFEEFGGHGKGRGFTPATFSRHGPQSPLYPLPPFGVGANMAFRREALARIGGFDVALGAGTPTYSAEDTLALTMLLLAGYRIAYEPAALTRHHHRHDMTGLARQLRGYDTGLTAYYLALLRHQPGQLPGLIRLVPTAIGFFLRERAGAEPDAEAPVTGALPRRQLWWMLAGPLAYARSLRKQARTARRAGGGALRCRDHEPLRR
jgi:glycosyltransferase involved in cell wall biosynthesis